VDVAAISAELSEIDMLLQQATAESARHEQRVEQASERLAQLTSGRTVAVGEVIEANQSLMAVTRKAAVMQGSIDVLEGKKRMLVRYRDRLEELAASVEAAEIAVGESDGSARSQAHAVARIVSTAQEDLRREIARSMHDGPAQSMTNIVLQAQIVDRLIGKDPEAARAEVDELVRMVSRTLEATKTFIFEVRPMVLDDLGLLPTLRRDARERSQRSQVPIDFDSAGADRRLPADVESTLFRMIDEALAGYVSTRPDRISLRLDWGIRLVVIVATPYVAPIAAIGTAEEREASEVAEAAEARAAGGQEALPPALAAMMRDRVTDAAPQIRDPAGTALAEEVWRGIVDRASTIGADVDLDEEGHRVRVAIDLASPG
jgi:two-component system sensor histidine kinase DegS